MISVQYVAPLKRPDTHVSQACHLDPYAMLLSKRSGMLYVVEVRDDWQEGGFQEGDQLIVDEMRTPRIGDIVIYGADSSLYACRIHKRNGVLCPVGHGLLSHNDNVIFGGVVTKLVRLFYD